MQIELTFDDVYLLLDIMDTELQYYSAFNATQADKAHRVQELKNYISGELQSEIQRCRDNID